MSVSTSLCSQLSCYCRRITTSPLLRLTLSLPQVGFFLDFLFLWVILHWLVNLPTSLHLHLFACELALGCEAIIVSICGPSCEFTPTHACGLRCVLALKQEAIDVPICKHVCELDLECQAIIIKWHHEPNLVLCYHSCFGMVSLVCW